MLNIIRCFIIFYFTTNIGYTARVDNHYQTLNSNWSVTPLDSLHNIDGKAMSRGNYSDEKWKYHNITIPATAMGVIVQSQQNPAQYEKHIFKEDNLEQVNKKRFRQPWFFRKQFNLLSGYKNAQLIIQGINYYAEIWVNGHHLVHRNSLLHDQIINPFIQYKLDISKYIKFGQNAIAVEVIPPFCFHYSSCYHHAPYKKGDYTGDFNIGFVDWSPTPPDFSMGITRPISLHLYNEVSISNPVVQSKLSADYNSAMLSIKADINTSQGNGLKDSEIYHITAKINNHVVANKDINLSQGQYYHLKLNTTLQKPELKLWWPYQLGKPYLYSLTLTVQNSKNKRIADQITKKFGIRDIYTTVKQYYTADGKSHYARIFKVNGKQLLIRGSEWVDGEFLNDSHNKINAELAYVRSMGLNTIRLEGFWGSDSYLYDEADRLGILLLPGWSCQWEWPYYLNAWVKPGDPTPGTKCDEKYGCIQSKDDINLISLAFKSQVLWLRNHPSIMAWVVGSDMLPKPDLEKRYEEILANNDPSREYILSAQELYSSYSHKHSGLKMSGPYAYEPPIYWFQDHANGGAFGFASEINPGAELPERPTLEEIFPFSLAYWNQSNKVWDYHAGRGEFNSLMNYYNPAINARYGQSDNIENYIQRAQINNYEAMRAMFEAYIAYQSGNPNLPTNDGTYVPATGIIQWKLTSSWPATYWQLFDYYLRPNSAFYGAQEANRILHVMYNPANNTIYISNLGSNSQFNLKVKATLYDLNSKKIRDPDPVILTELKNNASELVKGIALGRRSKPSFLDLRLFNEEGDLIDSNFYWLPLEPDTMDYANTSWFRTPIAKYADLSVFSGFSSSTLQVECHHGLAVNEYQVALTNNSESISFFNTLRLMNNDTEVLPSYWSANDISLLPHEKRTLNVKFDHPMAGKIQVTALNSPSVIAPCH